MDASSPVPRGVCGGSASAGRSRKRHWHPSLAACVLSVVFCRNLLASGGLRLDQTCGSSAPKQMRVPPNSGVKAVSVQ